VELRKKTEEFEDGGLALKSVSSKPKVREELQIHPHIMQKMVCVYFNTDIMREVNDPFKSARFAEKLG